MNISQILNGGMQREREQRRVIAQARNRKPFAIPQQGRVDKKLRHIIADADALGWAD